MPTGELVGNTGYYITMMGRSIQSATRADAQKREISEYLESLQGKTLYKAGFTEVIQSDIALQDLLDRNKRALARNRTVANLSPLKVLETRHLEAENAVVVKVGLPDGGEGLLFGNLQSYDQKYADQPSMLYRLGIHIGEQRPAKFSAKEIAAIKEGTLFRGMSEDALYWSWGYPDKTNNWGSGGKQHIYSGSQYVYVEAKRVTDWQSLR